MMLIDMGKYKARLGRTRSNLLERNRRIDADDIEASNVNSLN